MNNKKIVEVANVTKKYINRNQIVIANNNISFDIYENEIVGIFGHNGAGKTTLIKQIVGLLKPDKGSIKINGEDISSNKRPKLLNKIGYLGQGKSGTLWHLKVKEALYFTARIKGLDSESAKTNISFLVNTLQLHEHQEKLVMNLSTGLHQLVDLALALIGNPELVILDEPTTYIDPFRRKIIWDTITNFKDTYRASIILVTHNLSEAENFVSKIIIMEKGEIIKQGTLNDIKKIIDDNIYITIKENVNMPFDNSFYLQMHNIGKIEYTQNTLIICTDKKNVNNVINIIFNKNYYHSFIDFKVNSSSLEDIYQAVLMP